MFPTRAPCVGHSALKVNQAPQQETGGHVALKVNQAPSRKPEVEVKSKTFGANRMSSAIAFHAKALAAIMGTDCPTNAGSHAPQ